MPKYPPDPTFGYIREAMGFWPESYCTSQEPNLQADLHEGAVFNEIGDECPNCGLRYERKFP